MLLGAIPALSTRLRQLGFPQPPAGLRLTTIPPPGSHLQPFPERHPPPAAPAPAKIPGPSRLPRAVAAAARRQQEGLDREGAGGSAARPLHPSRPSKPRNAPRSRAKQFTNENKLLPSWAAMAGAGGRSCGHLQGRLPHPAYLTGQRGLRRTQQRRGLRRKERWGEVRFLLPVPQERGRGLLWGTLSCAPHS